LISNIPLEIVSRKKSLKPIALAMLALLGIVVAGNFPPDSAGATDRMIYICFNPPTYALLNQRQCPDGIGYSWSARTPEIGKICIVNRSGQMLATPRPNRCGPGKKMLTFGTYSSRKILVTACVDRRTKKMYLASNGTCGNRIKLQWVKSAPYLPIASTTTSTGDPTTTTEDSTTTTETSTTTSSSSTTTTSTIAPTCANGRAACSLGDTGPGGGKVFYIDTADDFGWEYLEAAPSDWRGASEILNWSCLDADLITSATTLAVGSGRANTLSMLRSQSVCAPGAIAAQVVTNLNFGGKSDWFIPSLSELQEMASANSALGLGMDATYSYWSSSHSVTNADSAWGFDLSSQTSFDATKGGLKVRPIRAFGSGCEWGGECAVGDLGPGGGRVFFVDSADEFENWNYLEIAPFNWNGASELTGTWCDGVTTGYGATSEQIGDGQNNFEVMNTNCSGVADIVADYESEHNDLNIGGWFIPSSNELLAAYTTLKDLGYWTDYDIFFYWTSSEFAVLPSNARILVPFTSSMSATLKSQSAGVIPVRAF